ncbi:MAG: AbrB family transcriptional regulator [Burkholderiales bacterium]|nr:AbrB family transcriptional regulator [Burkholderiales bacterium]
MLVPLQALVVCGLGGAVFQFLKTPLPWMIGPLLAMASLKMSGLHFRAPTGGRQLGQLIIGTALGLYFTPLVAQQVLGIWPVLIAAALMAMAIGGICGLFLARFSDTDRTTAFFASVPGGAVEMAILAERFGAKIDRIAMAQSLRIMMVVVIIPFALTFLGAHGADAYDQVSTPINAAGLLQLLVLGLLGGALLAWLGMPNAFMLGPLAITIALTVGEVQLSSMPKFVSNLGQLLIGCTLGARFEQEFVKKAPRYMLVVAASVLLAIMLAALSGLLLASLGGLAIPTMVLATAPGGIAEMCITAKVLRLGVPLVTAAHVTRVLMLVTTTAPMCRLVLRLSARRT